MSDSAHQPGSDEEWAALMRQLQRQSSAQPQTFFYARVQARLLAKLTPSPTWLPRWARRPAYLALLGTLVLAMSSDGAALRRATAASQPSPPSQPRTR